MNIDVTTSGDLYVTTDVAFYSCLCQKDAEEEPGPSAVYSEVMYDTYAKGPTGDGDQKIRSLDVTRSISHTCAPRLYFMAFQSKVRMDTEMTLLTLVGRPRSSCCAYVPKFAFVGFQPI
jgi:hypothetical protein